MPKGSRSKRSAKIRTTRFCDETRLQLDRLWPSDTAAKRDNWGNLFAIVHTHMRSHNVRWLPTYRARSKRSGDRQFIIVDAAITELIRPALYGSFHFGWPVAPKGGLVPPDRRKDLNLPGTELADIVGPVCESGDFLAKDRRLPPVSRGDLICIYATGAYGFTMSSQYNSRPRAAEVLVDGDAARIIRRRETYEDLVAAERLAAEAKPL